AGLDHEPLAPWNLVDIIWIPAGAASVRVVPGWHVAAVTDGLGHLLLVDISRIDERFAKDGTLAQPSTALFPTVSASLSAKGAYGVGKPDPRILWRSEKPVASGTLAPLVDPRTGMVYAGRLLQKKLEVIAALEPRLRVLVDLGDGVLKDTGGIVPLGVSQKGTIEGGAPPGALAAFRLEIWLPGGIANALQGGFRVAIESERVYKALAEQMPEGWPRAHLRLRRPDGPVLDARRGGIPGLVFRDTLGGDAYDHPRLGALRTKFKALAGRDPFGRFNTIAPYTWALSDKANTPVAPGSDYGQRGSPKDKPVHRDYVFVAGNEYGLLVVEAGGEAPAG
ncbi:MAG: hypothetical protein LC732_06155, partial [Acidobacteria bacterium]|nr:hypothetical protein [Acidobacteriota bacterium]